ncbi:cyclin-dependent kinase inhibitor 5-like [Diospyros lotus]|uniref:cyclin-dependent kinase inhibitor 5-like n=1 Tax=Diospyros lotus TaxID=55363 RepID=UPI00225407BF|nr:cyclin-dependent kinase inhibitor 5-like [Diospyros lotus]
MGKYMRKAKTAAAEVAVLDVAAPAAQSSLGVRTRARTLALQRLQKSASAAASAPPSPPGTGSYLQLRSRRLEKPPIAVTTDSKRQRQQIHKETCVQNPSPGKGSRLKGAFVNSASVKKSVEGTRSEAEKVSPQEEENREKCNDDVEASFGENVLEFEGRERSTRESTPCSLIRDPESIRTPGSTTKATSSTEAHRSVQNSVQRHIPMAREMNEFFANEEEKQQRQFLEKYNFDPVNEKPLPGRYEWVKLDP